MARALTGTVAWDATKKTWRGRLSLVDGSRPWFDVPGLPHNERGEMRAREIVLERAAIARKEKLTSQDFVIAQRKPKVPDAPKGESWTVWHGRYLEVHEPSTIEDSVAITLVRATDTDLLGLARRAFRRGYGETLALIHAEFLRRRSGARAEVAA